MALDQQELQKLLVELAPRERLAGTHGRFGQSGQAIQAIAKC
jgi:hypothetical protein